LKTRESAENYLETIYRLSKSNDQVHSIDIVHELDYSKPSISIAMKNLRESGYIVIDEDGHITLTNSGLKIAMSMHERHTIMSDWLVSLGVDRKTADNDACKMEHSMSEKSFSAIKNHIEK
jgi:Mn-dependent transcriptional regulator